MRGQIVIAAVCVALCACASAPTTTSGESSVGESEIRTGTIVRIDPVQIEGDHQLGIGAVIGGLAGGALGYQAGGGSGKALATVAGTLLGGYAGEKVQNYEQKVPGQHITVRLANGVAVGVTQPSDPALRVGDAVRIDGAGPSARVLRQ